MLTGSAIGATREAGAARELGAAREAGEADEVREGAAREGAAREAAADEAPVSDARLAAVIDAWPDLSEPMKDRLAALARAQSAPLADLP